MKHMTNAQIDEINELLVNHSEALTAFYDEGITYGMRLGLKWILAGAVVGVACGIVVEIIKHIKNNRKTEEES